MKQSRWVTALVVCLGGANSARAEDAFFLMVFGSQRPGINQPRYTHSFATFVRVKEMNGRLEPNHVEGFTISWFPATLEIVVARVRPECGCNVDLHSSLAWARKNELRTSMWGPYQIDKALYFRALERKAELESGAICYRAADIGPPSDKVSNCIAALSVLAVGQRPLEIGLFGWGEPASYFITRAYTPWIVDSCRTHDWLIDRLALRGQCLVRRDLSRNPERNPIIRGIQAITQRNVGQR